MLVSLVMLVCLGYDNGSGHMVDRCELQLRHGYNASTMQVCAAKADKAANVIAVRREKEDYEAVNSYGKGMCMKREDALAALPSFRKMIEINGGTVEVKETEL